MHLFFLIRIRELFTNYERFDGTILKQRFFHFFLKYKSIFFF